MTPPSLVREASISSIIYGSPAFRRIPGLPKLPSLVYPTTEVGGIFMYGNLPGSKSPWLRALVFCIVFHDLLLYRMHRIAENQEKSANWYMY